MQNNNQRLYEDMILIDDDYIELHYKLSVARQALPRQLLVARHIKMVVPSVRADNLASPEYGATAWDPY